MFCVCMYITVQIYIYIVHDNFYYASYDIIIVNFFVYQQRDHQRYDRQRDDCLSAELAMDTTNTTWILHSRPEWPMRLLTHEPDP